MAVLAVYVPTSDQLNSSSTHEKSAQNNNKNIGSVGETRLLFFAFHTQWRKATLARLFGFSVVGRTKKKKSSRLSRRGYDKLSGSDLGEKEEEHIEAQEVVCECFLFLFLCRGVFWVMKRVGSFLERSGLWCVVGLFLLEGEGRWEEDWGKESEVVKMVTGAWEEGVERVSTVKGTRRTWEGGRRGDEEGVVSPTSG